MSGKQGNVRKNRDSNATVFCEQLQSEYNELLKRYAEAENTIDELRTGAKIRLYSDTQDIQPQTFNITENKRRSQLINISPPLKAVYTSEYHGESRDVLPFDEKVKTLKGNVQSLEDCLCENDISKANLEEIFNLTTELSGDLTALNSELSQHSSKPSEKGAILNKNEMKKELHRIKLRLDELRQDANTKLKSSRPTFFGAKKGNSWPQESGMCQANNERNLIKDDLNNLLTKLKELKSSGKSPEPSKAFHAPTKDIYNEDAQCSSDFQDFVDGRYLTPSPDYLQHRRETFGSVSDGYTDNEEQSFQQTFNKHPGQQYGASSSRGSDDMFHRHRTVPVTSYDQNENWLPQQQRSSQNSVRDSDQQTKMNNTKYEPRRLSSTSSFADKASRVPTNDRGSYDIARDNPRRSSNQHEHEPTSPRDRGRGSRRDSKPTMRTDNILTNDTKGVSTRDRRQVSPRVDDEETKKYQQTSTSNGFDSGFFGSEKSSRITTESPTIMQKLNLSNQYDSSLRLDLDGINESERETSPDNTSYRRCSTERTPSERTIESTLVDTSPSPFPSPSVHLKRFAYNTTYPPRRSRELIPDSRLTHSKSNKKGSRKGDEEGEAITAVTRDRYSTRDRLRGSGHLEDNRASILGEKPSEVGQKTNNEKQRYADKFYERPIRRNSLLDLREDMKTLRDQIESILDQSRLSQSFNDDSRFEDEQWRHSFERQNDQRFDDLTHTIEELRNEILSKRRTDYSPISGKNNSDLRNQINEISEKLQELSKFRENTRTQDTSPPVSGRDHVADHFKGLELQLDELKQQITELKADNEPVHYDATSCPRCDDTTTPHHSYHKHMVTEPRSPIVTHVHYESPRQSPNPRLSNLRDLSLSYPGANVQPSVIHHVHTCPTTSIKVRYDMDDETESSANESDSKRRNRNFKSRRRRSLQNRYGQRNHVVLRPEVINEARLATKDVQRLSKSILNKITLDLASFNHYE